MTSPRYYRLIRALCCVYFSLWLTPALAALGDRQSPPPVAGSASNAQQKTSKNYSVVEHKTGVTLVREYVNPDGYVFAIAWNGVAQPDLSVELGKYFAEYDQVARAAARPVGRTPVEVKTSQMVLVRRGHMRDVRGMAYDPLLLPPLFDLADLL